MSPKLKAKWIAALLSGEYRQGRGRLKHAGRYCCLGVLCEVANYKPSNNGLLTIDECAQLGLDEGLMCQFSYLNDGKAPDGNRVEPLSFPEIAEHIRGAV